MAIRETLNQQAFPGPQNPAQSVYHQKLTSPNIMQTPISQMMQLKNWVEMLQSKAQLDPETGFLASLPNYIRFPANLSEEEKKAYIVKRGVETKQRIVSELINKLLEKLHYKRVVERPND